MEIPEFVMYKYVEGLDKVPESFVEFVVEERAEMVSYLIGRDIRDKDRGYSTSDDHSRSRNGSTTPSLTTPHPRPSSHYSTSPSSPSKPPYPST